jgi:peptidoglycan/xylan/chitin deacetylase (PgdA/CDA1 family)
MLTPGGSFAGGATPQIAFYTYQAPGGATTAGQRVIALTFDDGPGPYTPQVLSVLEQYGVPATFFETGENVAEYPQYTAMVAAAGYPVENHTWSHPDLTTLPAAQVSSQIDMAQTEIRWVIGQTPDCLRPPYDAWNVDVLDQVAASGVETMSYSVDPRDWSMPGVSAIVSRVVGAAFPGAVVDMHDGGGDRSETVAALPAIITDLRAEGYRFVPVCGYQPPPPQQSAVYAYGAAPAPGAPIVSSVPYVGAAATGAGYWLVAADGGVFSSGVPFLGSLPSLNVVPASPVVGMAATSDGGGYWLVAADGGVFSFGDAVFQGSMGGKPLNAPIVGMAATSDGGGYWLVAADGGVFSFGDAVFQGSMGGKPLNAPIVGIASDTGTSGYWLVAADGGVFGFGDAVFQGSMGGKPLNAPIVGIASDAGTSGYWLVATDGGVFAFDAPFLGCPEGATAALRFFAVLGAVRGSGYLVAGERAVTPD